MWLSCRQTTAPVIAGCGAARAYFGGVFAVLVPDYVPRNCLGPKPANASSVVDHLTPRATST